MNSSTPQAPFRVAALYRFCRLEAFEALRQPLGAFCCARGIKGTLLLAHEGINGTVAGDAAAIAALIDHLEAIPELAGLEMGDEFGNRRFAAGDRAVYALAGEQQRPLDVAGTAEGGERLA